MQLRHLRQPSDELSVPRRDLTSLRAEVVENRTQVALQAIDVDTPKRTIEVQAKSPRCTSPNCHSLGIPQNHWHVALLIVPDSTEQFHRFTNLVDSHLAGVHFQEWKHGSECISFKFGLGSIEGLAEQLANCRIEKKAPFRVDAHPRKNFPVSLSYLLATHFIVEADLVHFAKLPDGTRSVVDPGHVDRAGYGVNALSRRADQVPVRAIQE